MKAYLDEYVIGQEDAKKILCVAAYNHYIKVQLDIENELYEEEYLRTLEEELESEGEGEGEGEGERDYHHPSLGLEDEIYGYGVRELTRNDVAKTNHKDNISVEENAYKLDDNDVQSVKYQGDQFEYMVVRTKKLYKGFPFILEKDYNTNKSFLVNKVAMDTSLQDLPLTKIADEANWLGDTLSRLKRNRLSITHAHPPTSPAAVKLLPIDKSNILLFGPTGA
eukprot:Ihof_evm2s21 gene=Ihof_evmTU2s21